jgi:DNA-binding transcriptional regulator YiaG
MSPTHPNRSRRAEGPARHPSPDEIRAVRTHAGLTQAAAASRIYATERAWQAWEQAERPMHPGLWELFCAKVGLTGAVK